MKTILIVDDERDLTEALKVLLEDEGYRVFIAGDGKACLSSLYEVKPNLVLLDVMIPYIDGYEVLKIMKSQPIYSSIPVVLMSASRPKFRQAEYKWNAFITKPFHLEFLLENIHNLIGSKKAAA